MAVCDEPAMDVVDGLVPHALRVQSGAQIAKRLPIGVHQIADAIVRFPPEILGVESVVGVQSLQIERQLLGRVMQGVDVRVRRR